MPKKMTAAQIKKAWMKAMADLACGRRSEECVRAFDRLTSDMLATKRITIDEFMAAQTVIGAAYLASRQIAKHLA